MSADKPGSTFRSERWLMAPTPQHSPMKDEDKEKEEKNAKKSKPIYVNEHSRSCQFTFAVQHGTTILNPTPKEAQNVCIIRFEGPSIYEREYQRLSKIHLPRSIKGHFTNLIVFGRIKFTGSTVKWLDESTDDHNETTFDPKRRKDGTWREWFFGRDDNRVLEVWSHVPHRIDAPRDEDPFRILCALSPITTVSVIKLWNQADIERNKKLRYQKLFRIDKKHPEDYVYPEGPNSYGSPERTREIVLPNIPEHPEDPLLIKWISFETFQRQARNRTTRRVSEPVDAPKKHVPVQAKIPKRKRRCSACDHKAKEAMEKLQRILKTKLLRMKHSTKPVPAKISDWKRNCPACVQKKKDATEKLPRIVETMKFKMKHTNKPVQANIPAQNLEETPAQFANAPVETTPNDTPQKVVNEPSKESAHSESSNLTEISIESTHQKVLYTPSTEEVIHVYVRKLNPIHGFTKISNRLLPLRETMPPRTVQITHSMKSSNLSTTKPSFLPKIDK